jgi:hypothetical protein
MVNVNKLAALQKKKWKKRVLIGYFQMIPKNKRDVRIKSD